MTAYDRATIAQATHHDTALRAIRAAQAALAEPRRRYVPFGNCELQPRRGVRLMRSATEHEVALARLMLNYKGKLEVA